ncbi:MAG: HAD family hydrolase [Candidatus Omnitrophica bacterium]|nr:HAD family hydrolase [Candidatus Omnitrophota bacterium]
MKVVFLDRDGVINEYPGDFEYVKSWAEFHFLPDIKPALKRLNDNGYKIFIISNQAGVSKGIYSQRDLDLITENMLKELGSSNIDIAGVYYCTHLPEDNCACRKPQTGLIEKAMEALKGQGLDIEKPNSYFIGDSIRDIETGKNRGLKTILVFSGKENLENKDNWKVFPDFTAQGLSAAVDLILKDK